MEFNVIHDMVIEFVGGSSSEMEMPPPPPAPKRKKVISIKRTHNSSHTLTLTPVLDLGDEEEDESCGITIAGNSDGKVGFKSFPDITIELLVGDTEELAKQLKDEEVGRVTTHLTFTAGNMGRMTIATGRMPPGNNKDVDIFDGLLKLQENLPENSVEFTLCLKDFAYEDGDNQTWCSYDDENEMEFVGKGLKLKRNEDGLATLESGDIQVPSDNWWELWRHSRVTTFTGLVSVNVKLEVAAIAELYKKKFGQGALATEKDLTMFAEADMVFFVGGNKDKENGIKCHKSILAEMSPVFQAIFETDVLEAKESSLEVVDFSEACVRALIDFAYRRDVGEALKNSDMALELLQLADKYEMKELTEILLHVIWSMPFLWFSPDLAIKFFFFAKNAGEDLAEAEKKAWKVLKWYVKKFPEKLMQSEEYILLCENPRAVMELLKQVLKK